MNRLEIKGDWNIIKGKLKQGLGKLTGNELQFAKGRVDELVGRIEKRTAWAKEAVERALRDYGIREDIFDRNTAGK